MHRTREVAWLENNIEGTSELFGNASAEQRTVLRGVASTLPDIAPVLNAEAPPIRIVDTSGEVGIALAARSRTAAEGFST